MKVRIVPCSSRVTSSHSRMVSVRNRYRGLICSPCHTIGSPRPDASARSRRDRTRPGTTTDRDGEAAAPRTSVDRSAPADRRVGQPRAAPQIRPPRRAGRAQSTEHAPIRSATGLNTFRTTHLLSLSRADSTAFWLRQEPYPHKVLLLSVKNYKGGGHEEGINNYISTTCRVDRPTPDYSSHSPGLQFALIWGLPGLQFALTRTTTTKKTQREQTHA